jgi:hypothetical protein
MIFKRKASGNHGGMTTTRIPVVVVFGRLLVTAMILLVGLVQVLLLFHAPATTTNHMGLLALQRGGRFTTAVQRQRQRLAEDVLQILSCGDLWDNDNNATKSDDAVRLLCRAARSAMATPPQEEQQQKATTSPQHYCDPDTTAGRDRLFGIWQHARDQVNHLDLLRRALQLGHGKQYTLVAGHSNKHHSVTLWAPPDDIGLTTVLEELQNNAYGLTSLILPTLMNAAAAKVAAATAAEKDDDDDPTVYFVDMGANLGIVSLAVALEAQDRLSSINNNNNNTTKTTTAKLHIVAVEAAAPTWLFQLLNVRCNLQLLPHDDDENDQVKNNKPLVAVTSVLAGLDDRGDGVLNMTWREHSTTSTRSWTPDDERRDTDIQLAVPTRTLESILSQVKQQPYSSQKTKQQERRPYYHNVAALKVDCEGRFVQTTQRVARIQTAGVGRLGWLRGSFRHDNTLTLSIHVFATKGCEYNVIPALPEEVSCCGKQLFTCTLLACWCRPLPSLTIIKTNQLYVFDTRLY